MAKDKLLIVSTTLDGEHVKREIATHTIRHTCIFNEPVEVEEIDPTDDWNPWAHLHRMDKGEAFVFAARVE